jgi:hypothetical protein
MNEKIKTHQTQIGFGIRGGHQNGRPNAIV